MWDKGRKRAKGFIQKRTKNTNLKHIYIYVFMLEFWHFRLESIYLLSYHLKVIKISSESYKNVKKTGTRKFIQIMGTKKTVFKMSHRHKNMWSFLNDISQILRYSLYWFYGKTKMYFRYDDIIKYARCFIDHSIDLIIFS